MTQAQVEFALAEGNDQYDKLRDHIERNGGIYNPVWAVQQDGLFLIIEGNSRAYAYKELSEKYVHEPVWKELDSYILPERIERDKINFIRLEAHLFGQTPWDAYDKARELYRLHTDEDYPVKRLSQLTKLGVSDIKNHIQAYMDMNEQYLPTYDKPGERLKFSYFLEFTKNKELRKLRQEARLSLSDFCEWVGQGKFRRGEEVRRLALVLKDDEARQALVDDNFEAALDQLEQKNPTVKSKLFEKIEDVISGLENMPFNEYGEIKRGLQPAKLNLLKTLDQTLANFLRHIGEG